ncbi:MAG: glutaredoxin family protein [Candidatus Thermoplasmatota archaeon]
MVDMEIVEGEDKGKIMLYALSTCVWCRRTKNLLDDLGVKYSYIYVDKLDGEEKESVKEEIKKHNSKFSFPTLVIDGETVVGFKEDKIRDKLEG